MLERRHDACTTNMIGQSPVLPIGRCSLFSLREPWLLLWNKKAEKGAPVGSAFHADAPRMFLDYLMRNGQPKSSALASFCGVERLKNPYLVGLGHARSVVSDFEDEVAVGVEPGRDIDFPGAGRDGIAGVGQQVEQAAE